MTVKKLSFVEKASVGFQKVRVDLKYKIPRRVELILSKLPCSLRPMPPVLSRISIVRIALRVLPFYIVVEVIFIIAVFFAFSSLPCRFCDDMAGLIPRPFCLFCPRRSFPIQMTRREHIPKPKNVFLAIYLRKRPAN